MPVYLSSYSNVDRLSGTNPITVQLQYSLRPAPAPSNTDLQTFVTNRSMTFSFHFFIKHTSGFSPSKRSVKILMIYGEIYEVNNKLLFFFFFFFWYHVQFFLKMTLNQRFSIFESSLIFNGRPRRQ